MTTKIALHTYQLGTRGTEVCVYKYAKYLRDLKGYEPVIISSDARPTPTLPRFEKEFEVFLYSDKHTQDGENLAIRSSLAKIVQREQIDFLYSLRGGDDDGILRNMPCRTGAHSIFRMDQPHGDVYAGVCEYISEKYGKKHPWVDHIVDYPRLDPEDNLREKLGIPADALVGFRHGGETTFNLGFAYAAIQHALNVRPDLWFIFLNTRKFMDHPRVIHLPWTGNLNEILRFVNTGDFFMHARYDGEIFPLTCAEAATQNKPIVTWYPFEVPDHYDTGHIKLLGDKGFYYKDPTDLVSILVSLDRDYILNEDWDIYGKTYSPEVVVQQFEDVFLKGDK